MAASGASRSAIVTAGIAGLMAGAGSMAAGEYVSVSSQRDTEDADLRLERHELATDPEGELRELTGIYEDRGLKPELAAEVARGLTEAFRRVRGKPATAAEQLDGALDRFLDFVEDHAAAYMAIFRSRGGGGLEIEAVLEEDRQLRLNALIDSLAASEAASVQVRRTPLLETALQRRGVAHDALQHQAIQRAFVRLAHEEVA